MKQKRQIIERNVETTQRSVAIAADINAQEADTMVGQRDPCGRHHSARRLSGNAHRERIVMSIGGMQKAVE